MECRFPTWLAYAFLGLFTLAFGAVGYLIQLPVNPSHPRHGVVVYIFAILSLALLWACLHAKRYRLQITGEAVIIIGVFRTRTISLSAIKQVVTMTALRSGTDSWLVDANDQAIAKIDGSLGGYDLLIIRLGQALQSRQVLFYRFARVGPWEMQVAGDSHWVPYKAPSFIRRRGPRVALLIGLVLVIAAVVARW